MRLRIYNALVNRVPGIYDRYHTMHDNSSGIIKIGSWIYLLLLNFAYYILQFKWLDSTEETRIYQQKKLLTKIPESELMKHTTFEDMLGLLSPYNIISFDIFDTLIFRPFSDPTDLFYIVGQKLGYMDFKRIRVECEKLARRAKLISDVGCEVNIAEIWEVVEQKTGIDKTYGMNVEIETELELCYCNDYMQKIYAELLSMGKHIVFTSDMYLPSDVLQRILDKCGYTSYEWLYVSCDEAVSKATGGLFTRMIEDQKALYGNNVKIIHIGDNVNSDFDQARKSGIKAYLYQNVNINSKRYRSYDLSPIIGGAYRGIVNNRLYSGISKMSCNQEYGFIYGGLFIIGYSHFIHEYCKANKIEKLLFLSRDGAIIKKAYDYLYPDSDTEYAYISRFACAKWAAKYMKYDYFRKLIMHKVGSGKKISMILQEMELESLITKLSDFDLKANDKLTVENKKSFEQFINSNWNEIIQIYDAERNLAKKYYSKMVGDSKRLAVVDIGWAGSGFIALKELFKKEWGIDCELIGIIAGTNTALSSETDMSETFLLDGSLVSYLYSSGFNRDIWKKHNPNLGFNLYFELLTSAPEPSFKGFIEYNGEITPRFTRSEPNKEGILEIWEGIMTFVKDYSHHFSNYQYMFNITGRDAYAPMLLAESFNERYLKKIYKEFNLTINVE